jgi:hypothetical protein
VVSGAITAIPESKSASSESTTVRLSDEAKGRYAADQDKVEERKENSENPLHQAFENKTEEAGSSGGGDPVAETLARLQEMLKEALKRLKAAQQQMALAMAEMSSAGDDAQRMAAMTKVQAAQALVASAQGEVMQINMQINKILAQQQKQASGE